MTNVFLKSEHLEVELQTWGNPCEEECKDHYDVSASQRLEHCQRLTESDMRGMGQISCTASERTSSANFWS